MNAETQSQPLDPTIQSIERRWQEAGIPGLYAGGNGPVSRERASNIRAFLYPKPALPTGQIERASIAGPGGEIAIRIVQPHQGRPNGTLVYFHGGGWIIGDLDSHEAHVVRIANRAGVTVVNVAYRLAPEHRFPAAPLDAIAAVRWADQHKGRLGGAAAPLAVGGDSAGGNLAAVTAIQCRDDGIALGAQLLIYPATDLTALRDPDIRQAYFGDRAEELARDPRASPLLSTSLAGVAPAILGVGRHDFLYGDNLAYAAALRRAGVRLIMREHPTLNHGFFSYTGISPVCAAAADELCDDLRALLGR